jgi:hypothetical protein
MTETCSGNNNNKTNNNKIVAELVLPHNRMQNPTKKNLGFVTWSGTVYVEGRLIKIKLLRRIFTIKHNEHNRRMEKISYE